MERYDSYKDSGIYFLPNLPSNWEIRKAKYLFKEENRPVRPEDEIVTCFRDGQVTLRKNRRTEGFTNSLKEIGYQGVRKGDLVIHNMDAFAGAIGISDSDGKGTPVYSCCTPKDKKVNQYYYCYLLRYLARNGFILSLAKGIRERSTDFRFNDFKELYLPVPSISEQTSIVDYLDTAISKIDAAIAQQQKMIDLLNERKQIIINNAVTKGLDPNVKMKPSDIDWIGDIPKHWKFLPGKSLFKENKVKNINGKEKNVLSLSYGKIIRKKELIEGLQPENYNGYQIVEPDYIIIRCTDLQNDHTSLRTGLVKEHGIITGAYLGLIPSSKMNPKYLHLYLHAFDISKEIYRYGSGTRQSLGWNDFKNLPILCPTHEEQEKICEYVTVNEQKINTQIKLLEEHIILLQERKQIIINDVVTGKVKVV